MNYEQAKIKLNGRQSKKLGHNTYLQQRAGGIAVMLHETDIVLYRPNGQTVLNSGGYMTKLTRDRLNLFGPIPIRQEKGQWIIGPDTAFFDGMVIGNVNGKDIVFAE